MVAGQLLGKTDTSGDDPGGDLVLDHDYYD